MWSILNFHKNISRFYCVNAVVVAKTYTYSMHSWTVSYFIVIVVPSLPLMHSNHVGVHKSFHNGRDVVLC